MHPADIKALIAKRGSNLTEIALNADLPPSSCRVALLYAYSPRGDLAIAKFLKKPLHQLWPKRYSETGERLVGYSKYLEEFTQYENERHCQNEDAA